LNALSGAASSLTVSRGPVGGVAFWAHVGGFITGLILIKVLPTRKQYYSFDEY
jgi:membrane associated rhomboid family serine protease